MRITIYYAIFVKRDHWCVLFRFKTRPIWMESRADIHPKYTISIEWWNDVSIVIALHQFLILRTSLISCQATIAIYGWLMSHIPINSLIRIRCTFRYPALAAAAVVGQFHYFSMACVFDLMIRFLSFFSGGIRANRKLRCCLTNARANERQVDWLCLTSTLSSI